MTISKMLSRTGRVGAFSALALMTVAGATPAAAQSNPLNSVVGCDAPGTKQRDGAILGGLAGAAAGAAVAKRDGQGALIGGLLGAAAGSYLGCQKQKEKQAQVDTYDRDYGYGYGDYDRTYERGYEPTYGANTPLARGVRPAAYTPSHQQFVAISAVNLRAAPTTQSAKIGQLYSGERFEALGMVQGSDWVLVGRDGVGVGYVNRAYLQPAGSDRYARGYGR